MTPRVQSLIAQYLFPQNNVNFCSKFDLYTKSAAVPDIAALKPYYQGLIDKYLPGVVSF